MRGAFSSATLFSTEAQYYYKQVKLIIEVKGIIYVTKMDNKDNDVRQFDALAMSFVADADMHDYYYACLHCRLKVLWWHGIALHDVMLH